jgi:hypothetical protein
MDSSLKIKFISIRGVEKDVAHTDVGAGNTPQNSQEIALEKPGVAYVYTLWERPEIMLHLHDGREVLINLCIRDPPASGIA